MKKLRAILICTLLFCSSFIFVACSGKVESIAFQDKNIVMEVGETYDPVFDITPSGKKVNIELTSSNEDVVTVSEDSKIVAIAQGVAQIHAKTKNNKRAYLTVEVVAHKQSLECPVGVTYDSVLNRIVWEGVRNANSYDVEINGQVVLEKTTNLFMEVMDDAAIKSVRVKANGINQYKDSEYSATYKFQTLKAPKDLAFNKQTGVLTWDYENQNASYRVYVDSVASDIVTQKSYALELSESGQYKVSVVAVNTTDNQIDGINYFDSVKSEPIKITRLQNVDENSFVWNATEKMLSWSMVENATYKIAIDEGEYQNRSENFAVLNDLNKGRHTIRIMAVSNNALTLDSFSATEKEVDITDILSAPSIVEYNEAQNKLTIQNFGEAKEFEVTNGKRVVYRGFPTIEQDKSTLDLFLRESPFKDAGTYNVSVKAIGDSFSYLLDSLWSESYEITKLAAIEPESIKINNGVVSFPQSPIAGLGYSVHYMSGNTKVEQSLTENSIDLSQNINDGDNNIYIRYNGNGKNILMSDDTVVVIKKLLAPVVSFDKTTDYLTVSTELDRAFGFVTLDEENSNAIEVGDGGYALDNLIVGENKFRLWTIAAQENEISSEPIDITITKSAPMQQAEHSTVDGISYVSFKTNELFDDYVVTKLGDIEQTLTFVPSEKDGITSLRLTQKTSELFGEEFFVTLVIQALSNDNNTKNPDPVTIEIHKLQVPQGLQYDPESDTLIWDAVLGAAGVSVTYSLEIIADNLINEPKFQTVVSDRFARFDEDTFENFDEISLGKYIVYIQALGDNKNVVDSEVLEEAFKFTRTQLLKKPVIEFNKAQNSLTITVDDENINYLEVYIDDLNNKVATLEYPCSTFEFKNSLDESGEHNIVVKAVNTLNQYIVTSCSETLKVIKLGLTDSISFENETLHWGAVENADEYILIVDGQQYGPFLEESFSTSSLEPGTYSVSIIAKSKSSKILDGFTKTFTFELSRQLTTPTGLDYSKESNKLTFNAVSGADVYEIFINDWDPITTTSTEYAFDFDTFEEAGEYEIKVAATSNLVNVLTSMKSQPIKIKRLFAPQEIRITEDEKIYIEFDSTTQTPQVLVKDDNSADFVEVENLSEFKLTDFEGIITILVKFVGTNDYYLDSVQVAFTRQRLTQISGLRIENNKIMWNKSTFAQNYVLSVKPQDVDNVFSYNINADQNSYDYKFAQAGEYAISIRAIGNLTEYLSSKPSSIAATKATAPTNVAVVEDTDNAKITVSFNDNSTDLLGYEILANGQSVSLVEYDFESENKYAVISSEALRTPGAYSIVVVAKGDNSKNTIDSSASTPFETERLRGPSTFGMGANYYVQWEHVHNLAHYNITISSGKGDNYVEWDSFETTNNFIFFSDDVLNNEAFKDYEGTVDVLIQTVGNNTTLLRCLTIAVAPIEKAPRPVVTSDADGIIIDAKTGTYIKMTIYFNDGETPLYDSEWVVNKNSEESGERFNIPAEWGEGTYRFVVQQFSSGQFLSSETEYTRKRLPIVKNYRIERDSTNEDIFNIVWDEDEDASGYQVVLSFDETGSMAIMLLYRGTDTKYTIPSFLPAGNWYFLINSIGSAEKGFSSASTFLNRTKLNASALGLNIDGGVLNWNEEYVSARCDGYKIVVNGDYANAIKTDNQTLSHALEGFSGSLNIKVKAIGKGFGLDSDYATINAIKLPSPQNIAVTFGAVTYTFNYTVENKEVRFIYDIADMEFSADQEGLEMMSDMLISGATYSLKMRAICDGCLKSDLSEAITVKIIDNPNTNNGTTYISTNEDRSRSYFNWTTVVGASQYTVRITDLSRGEVVSTQTYSGSSCEISGLEAGRYGISVKVIGGSEPIDGIHYLSSKYSDNIEFTVLNAPVAGVVAGELRWRPQDGAYNYYMHIEDGYKDCGNVTAWTFDGEYIDYVNETPLSVYLQAIGDGVEYLASAKTPRIDIVKPRPPEMLTLVDGALCWSEDAVYTYYQNTQNKLIDLEFLKNGVVYDEFQIGVQDLISGWPSGDNYLQNRTRNLPSGTYTLRIKQIGDSSRVISTEYAPQTMEVVVAPAPTNVFINDHLLQWEAVDLEDYSENQDITYVVYAFNSMDHKWYNIKETKTFAISVENSDNLLKPYHTALAVVTKGNTKQDGFVNYISGNMSQIIEIIVLGSTSDIQTVEGNLTWGIVANAVNYKILATQNGNETSNINVKGGVQSSYVNGLPVGEHDIKIRALGNGSSLNSTCVINGIWGQSSKFTKLQVVDVSTLGTNEDLMTGIFHWENIANNSGYNIFIDNSSLPVYITDTKYESQILDANRHKYIFQTKGNSAVPSEGNIAYISSDMSDAKIKQRPSKVDGVMVKNGILYWTNSNFVGLNTKYYNVEFFRDNVLVNKIRWVADSTNVVSMDYVTKVKFDVGGIVTEGSYDVVIKEIRFGEEYLTGIGSDSIRITKLKAPTNVCLVNGVLTWDAVEGADGYVIKLVDKDIESRFTEIDTGFVYDGNTNTYSWQSILERGDYIVKVRAVPDFQKEGTYGDRQAKLSSSWVNKYGEIAGADEVKWVIHQIPVIPLANITVDVNEITWNYPPVSNVPENKAYIIWRDGEATPSPEIVLSQSYVIDSMLKGIRIRTIPTSGNDFDYFASMFSESKVVVKPAAPTNLYFDQTTQVLTWDKDNSSDATYIVTYKINGSDVETSITVYENRFELTYAGQYEIYVQLQKSGTAIGTSERSEACYCEFTLFSEGNGSTENPFRVNNSNFQNIIYRPRACFELQENITHSLEYALGVSVKGSIVSVTPFCGKLNGNGKTITLSFNNPYLSSNFGLFAELNGANIYDLNISVNSTAYFMRGSNDMTKYIGILAGNANSSIISNVIVSGSISLDHVGAEDMFFGGLVGQLEGSGKITECSSSLNITVGWAYHVAKVGGIVGNLQSGAECSNTNNSGNITGANTVGGIVACNFGHVSRCSNVGNLSSVVLYDDSTSSVKKAHAITGGIVGENSKQDGKFVENCIVGTDSSVPVLTALNPENNSDVRCYCGGIVGVTDYNTNIINNTNHTGLNAVGYEGSIYSN